MTLGCTNSVDDLKRDFESLSGCCLEGERDGFDPVNVVAHWSSGDCTDRNGIVIFENRDGRVGVFEDSEDYTGHG